LKRFSYKNKYWRDKLDTLIDFPLENLDLSPYRLCQSSCAVYDLFAVSNHYGELGGGHYTAYAKNINDNSWLCFDDSNVSVTNTTKIKSEAAYLLFYRRKDTYDWPSVVPLKYVQGMTMESIKAMHEQEKLKQLELEKEELMEENFPIEEIYNSGGLIRSSGSLQKSGGLIRSSGSLQKSAMEEINVYAYNENLLISSGLLTASGNLTNSGRIQMAASGRKSYLEEQEEDVQETFIDPLDNRHLEKPLETPKPKLETIEEEFNEADFPELADETIDIRSHNILELSSGGLSNDFKDQ